MVIWGELLLGGAVSLINFAIHAMMTMVIVSATRKTAARTDHLHLYLRLSALMAVTMIVLMAAHVIEIGVWALCYHIVGVTTANATPFEFAFENYTALGYGDAVPNPALRLVGPVTALNGLLLIGWSVAIIFEVMRMAEVQIGRSEKRPRRSR